ncbi:hypothetical protein DdX_06921 [Ditylenchus destructor]|uniref:Uncharacterized protein n=1 Tax=Ditylenchus destructor TaxID=166010 RepID=A0AAD4NA83_9BILA|nr:hypothetical protein DdX_06921 [Ditylenchus destructor]
MSKSLVFSGNSIAEVLWSGRLRIITTSPHQRKQRLPSRICLCLYVDCGGGLGLIRDTTLGNVHFNGILVLSAVAASPFNLLKRCNRGLELNLGG